uniref:Uncharacterized protein n=1 Tax=Rhizophora mucronata TaxID=61149 RepID=A0A2P2KLT5_RHIMU
MHLTRKMDSD